MKLLLVLPLLLGFTSAVNATNYVECEAIYQVMTRQKVLWRQNYYEDKYDEAYEKALKDFEKRGCYYY